MSKRIQLSAGASEPYQHLLGLHRMVEKAAADAGLDQRLVLPGTGGRSCGLMAWSARRPAAIVLQ